jgi:hypothetical protein
VTAGVRRLAVAREPDRAGAEPTRATPEPDRATLRATARQLADQQISNREIGRRLGISKDKVKRLLDELVAERDTVAGHAEPDRAGAEPGRATGSPAEPADAGRLALDLTDDVRDDLAVLAAGGLSEQDAVACSLSYIANAVRSAWDYGVCPHGQLPAIEFRATCPTTQPPPGGTKG